MIAPTSESGNWPWLFTDNETNQDRHPGLPSESDFYKDALNNYVVQGETDAVNPDQRGTKCAPYGLMMIEPGQSEVIRLRLTHVDEPIIADQSKGETEAFRKLAFGDSFEQVFDERVDEAESFYGQRIDSSLTDQRRAIMRQAYAGLLWTKTVLPLQRQHMVRWGSQWRAGTRA